MIDRFEAGDVTVLSRELGMLDSALTLSPESRVKVIVFADTPLWDTVKLKVPVWTAVSTSLQEDEALQVVPLREFDDAELDAALRSIGHEEPTSPDRLRARDPRVSVMRSVLSFPSVLGLYAKLQARGTSTDSFDVTARRVATQWLDAVLQDAAERSRLSKLDIFETLVSVVAQVRTSGSRSLALEVECVLAALREREGGRDGAASIAFQALTSHDLLVDVPRVNADAPRLIEFRQQLLGSLLLSFSLEREAADVPASDFESWASARFLENFTFPLVIDGMLAWLDRLADDPDDVRLAPLVRAAVESRRLQTSIAFRLASPRILPALFLALEERPSAYPHLYREAARHVPITEDGLSEIRRRLDDPEEQCKELAIYLIGIHGDQTRIPEILRVLESEGGGAVNTALEALVEMGLVAVPHLCATLRSSHSSPGLRRLCAGALRGIGHRDSSVSEAIGQALTDGESGDSSLLQSALLAACVLRDRAHADAAVRGLLHSHSEVVLAAARYLSEMPVPRAAENLDEALSRWADKPDEGSRTDAVRRQLAFTLAQTGDPNGSYRVLLLLEESLNG